MSLAQLHFKVTLAWWRFRNSRRRGDRPRRSLDPGRWKRAWSEAGLEPPAGLLAQIEAAWQEPQRAYHTIDHLESGLALLAEYRDLAVRSAELDLAFYFHDAVYDPSRFDNEEKSAALGKAALLRAGAAPALAERIFELVMITKHEAEPPDPDSRLLVDVDLAILGAERAAFDRYEQAVREEYGFVPGMIFRRKRREILEGFLARPRIYHTPALFERFEIRARENLARAISDLS